MAASCRTRRSHSAGQTALPSATDGTYTLNIGLYFDAVCDMTNGGWTLIQSHVANQTSTESFFVTSGAGTYLTRRQPAHERHVLERVR